MATDKEFVISFNRLKVPNTVQAQKVILSAQVLQEQVFIQKERSLKNFKVNLYRECLFLPQFQHTLTFRIYSSEEKASKTLLKTFLISEDQLQKIQLKPMMLKSEEDGFELIWDTWIFSENSEDLNSLTDRDYSELDLPLDINDSESNEDEISITKKIRKLSSTDGSYSPTSFQEFEDHDGKFPSMFESDHHQYHCRIKVLQKALEGKDKNKIKNEVYTSLVKKISGIFGEKPESIKAQ